MSDNIIVLAAGKSSRMKMNKSKCAIPLLRKPIILHLINTLNKLNFKNKIVVLGYEKETLRQLLNDFGTYVYQEQQLGTGHAVSLSLPYLDYQEELTFIVCGDMPLLKEETIQLLKEYHLYNKNDLTVVSTIVDDPKRYGRLIKDRASNLVRIVEYKDASEKEKLINEVNTGIYCINTKILKVLISLIDNNNAQKEYYLTDLISLAYQNNYKVGVYQNLDSFQFSGIDDLTSLSLVEEKLRKDIIAKHLNNGVLMVSSDTITISDEAIIEPGVIVYPNTCINGKTIIQSGSIIGPNSELNDSIVANNTTIKHSLINNSQIGSNTTIGPFAQLRNDSIIGNNVRIGNFVEIKNSKIGNNTKIAHLTYVGDTICGENVNFGCGVVTVNYDGIKKNKTIIENNVFIGCNVNLIAPLTIKENSYIAAGSTITQDVPAKSLSIARTRQINKEDYIEQGHKLKRNEK